MVSTPQEAEANEIHTSTGTCLPSPGMLGAGPGVGVGGRGSWAEDRTPSHYLPFPEIACNAYCAVYHFRNFGSRVGS